VDLVIIRENTEGLYSGIEAEITSGVVTSTKVATEGACTRIARWAFRYARQRRRTKVTVFHKANIMKLTDGMSIRCARAVHDGEFPEIDYQEMIIDAGCMALVRDPTRFDVLLLQNLYGDVLSDLCAGLVGGLGVVPGANIGESAAIFEAVHGSAPDIPGRDVANPLALLMSAMMLLNHLAETREDPACAAAAQRIKDGYNRALAEGRKTRDLSGSLGTRRFSDAVIDRLSS
jgi:isocitrate dehydrogenase (NAD+)